MSEEKDVPLEVVEEKDGTAVVNLPAEVEDEAEDKDPVEASAQSEDDDLQHAKRERRRAKRELAKKTSQEKDQRLVALQRQNDELLQRLQAIEQKTHLLDREKIERRAQDADLRLRYARQKVAEAGSAGDGEALAKAEEMLYNARKEKETFDRISQSSQKPETPKIDPRVLRNIKSWQDRTPWYDGNSQDLDSKIVKQVDEALTQEGWNPAEEDYWDELDHRLQQYLPHRFESGYNGKARPKNMQTSSGRESFNGGKQNFTLSAEQVRAMKDAGFWEDKKMREKMIRRYYEESRRRA